MEFLRSQLGEFRTARESAEVTDLKRVADLREVNDTLQMFARERQFQDDLKRPNVQLALQMWGGENVNIELTPDQLEDIKFDEGVIRIYPRMKAFEKVCDDARIKFPVDHLIAHQTELSEEAVTYAFGPDFLAKHHMVQRRSSLGARALSPSERYVEVDPRNLGV